MKNAVVQAPMDLRTLLTGCDDLSLEKIEALGKKLYSDIFLDNARRGLRSTHDGEQAAFFNTRFDHAFYVTNKTDRSKHKLVIDKRRVERIKWVCPLIEGLVPDSECWSVPKIGRDNSRLYIGFAQLYVVWLEPRDTGGWLFSSAYEATRPEIKGYQRYGRRIWTYGK